MLQQIRTATLVLIAMTIITGVVYPLVVTVIAQVAFPRQANGSLLRRDETVAGSELIGQPFSKPEYFWGRLSATGPVSYNAAASSGSNYGPLHPALREAVEGRIKQLQAAGGGGDIPVDLVTSSGSGLDPHISPAAAEYQVPRVAKARGISEDAVRRVVALHTRPRQFGLLGEPTVNVLHLNLALDIATQE